MVPQAVFQKIPLVVAAVDVSYEIYDDFETYNKL